MKLTKNQLRKIIKEELSKVLSEGEDDIDTPGGSQVLKPGALKDIVQGEFQAWLKEQEANRNKFRPGLGAGGNVGKAATQRSQVFYKVKRALMRPPYDYIDDVAASSLEQAGKQYDEEKVIEPGAPIYEEIYAILYDLIPRPRRYRRY